MTTLATTGITPEQQATWERDGFFVIRGFADPSLGKRMEAEMIDLIRSDPPEQHPGEPAYAIDGTLIVQPEARVRADAKHPEDRVSKVFNAHLVGTARDFAHDPATTAIVASLLGPDIDVFQTQFILKNPGAWGQPWHQDSYYFQFDQQPQIGLWLAITEATIENGCLYILPGSHHRPIHTHHPDKRAGANHGYLEIRDMPFEGAVPMLMEAGDLLVFHSFLMHRSIDNVATSRRAAMVYHYGRAGTINLSEHKSLQDRFTRWVPVQRAA